MLALMREVESDGDPSQRELAQRLNISLGLVNTFLRKLVNKGYFKLDTVSGNRSKYMLTPKGRDKKARLVVEYLQASRGIYRDVRNLLLERFEEMESEGTTSVVFFGVGEVAELAYLYIQLSPLELLDIVDDTEAGTDFFEFTVKDMERLKKPDWTRILLTRLGNVDQDIRLLAERGISPERLVIL